MEAEIYDSEPYAMIDRYLEAGIANGGLRTVAELAGFYDLDPVLVDRAIRFLQSIGHLEPESPDGSLTLTEPGWMSVRAGRRYTHALKDRRRLYFDRFTSRPLTSAYYEEPAVTFLDGAGIASASFPEIAAMTETEHLDGSGDKDPRSVEASARRWIQER